MSRYVVKRLGMVKLQQLSSHAPFPWRSVTSGWRRALSTSADRAASIAKVASVLRSLTTPSVVVLSGAGISTSAGIPDFRTPGRGLYDLVRTEYGLTEPEQIFDLDYFRHDPRPFLHLCKSLYPGRYKPSVTHRFIKLLQDKGLLRRNFTQNIDGLERLAGLSPQLLVEAHGGFARARCVECRSEQDRARVKTDIMRDRTPYCEACGGLVKPDIVFFGEALPPRFFEQKEEDLKPDVCKLMFIIGTSLQVFPFASLAHITEDIPRVFIGRERPRVITGEDDVVLIGDCDEVVREIAEKADWSANLKLLEAQPVPEDIA